MTQDLFGAEIKEVDPKRVKGNPCLRLYGAGPEGKLCKTCKHLWKHLGKYLKCDLRELTQGPGSDHRARWPACGKFEEEYS